MLLHFVKNQEIDFAKWDEALERCYNENPYAYSSWLNMVCPGWCAMMNKDYSVLIPLPVKKILGLSYLMQPRFTQQLGVFSIQPLDGSYIKNALLKIPKKYVKIHLQLNTENFSPLTEFKHRPTFCLNLNLPYAELYSNFNTNHKRNIKKALEISNKEDLKIVGSKDYKSFIEHFKNTIGLKDASLREDDYGLMHKLISSKSGKIILCTTHHDEILSGLFYLKSKTKVVNLFNFITPLGRDKKAMHLIIDHWIKLYAGNKLTLDFEGSEIKSIARFYSGFGASEKYYQLFIKKGFW